MVEMPLVLLSRLRGEGQLGVPEVAVLMAHLLFYGRQSCEEVSQGQRSARMAVESTVIQFTTRHG